MPPLWICSVNIRQSITCSGVPNRSSSLGWIAGEQNAGLAKVAVESVSKNQVRAVIQAQDCAFRLFKIRNYKYRRKYTLACACRHRPSTDTKTYAHFRIRFQAGRRRCAGAKRMHERRRILSQRAFGSAARIADSKPHCGIAASSSRPDRSVVRTLLWRKGLMRSAPSGFRNKAKPASRTLRTEQRAAHLDATLSSDRVPSITLGG